MNNDSLTIEQKRLRINGLLEKYNVGDKVYIGNLIKIHLHR